ncbi:hypothetical protein [Novosphingobium sp. CECT 9465]|uniref:hypothetical protein n=1 Tax=Novosphingobium sp. CECT 9465 TaxID=2829794 RepID=UPI001E4EB117|nr:hypothetical protein [Novosphingobium sp. CECT 9465]
MSEVAVSYASDKGLTTFRRGEMTRRKIHLTKRIQPAATPKASCIADQALVTGKTLVVDGCQQSC